MGWLVRFRWSSRGGWDFSSAGGTITFEATASVATTVNLTFGGGGNATTTFGKDIAIAAGTDTPWAFTTSDASSSNMAEFNS